MPAFHFPAFRIQKLYPLEVSYTTKKNPVPVGFSTNIILCYILCRLARAAPELRSVAAGIRPMGFFGGNPSASGRIALEESRTAHCLRQFPMSFMGFTFTPGPMVEVRVTLLRYWPFRALGFAFIIAFINVWKFSDNCSSVKEALPRGT